MATDQSHRPFSIGWLVAAYFAGALAWSAFHLVSYLWATLACSLPERMLIAATTAIASIVTVGAMGHGYRVQRQHFGTTDARLAAQLSSTDRFVIRGGVLLNAFFLASILLTSLAILFLGACE